METDGSFCGISILAVLADRDERRIPTRVPRRISILAVLADHDQGEGVGEEAGHISILAVLADRDLELDLSRKNRTKHFNPRGPCGPRHR